MSENTLNTVLEHLECQNFLRRPTIVGDIFKIFLGPPPTLNWTPGPMYMYQFQLRHLKKKKKKKIENEGVSSTPLQNAENFAKCDLQKIILK